MIYRFRKVLPDVYRGSAPALKDVASLVKKYNIKKIVSLDKEDGERIKKICKSLGINQIIFPMYGKRSDVLRLLSNNLEEMFLKGGPVFIHCSAGKDRTGFVSALLKVKFDDADPEEAIQEAKELGFGAFLPKEWRKAIKLYEDTIKNAKKDSNNADIVSNSREYIDDTRSSFLDKGTQQSFAPYAPYVDSTRKDPDNQYVTDTIMTEEIVVKDDKLNKVPRVGTYDNAVGIIGVGPVENYGGFLHD